MQSQPTRVEARVAIGMTLVTVATFGFRWLSMGSFYNDHFDHVARGYQVLLGDWPVRDFVDPGLPLTYLLSAAIHTVIVQPFLAEALLFASGLSIAAALSYRASFLAANSMAVAAFAVVLQVALNPRSYSYPKLLVYALAITVAWWAIDRLSVRRLAALAAVTGLAYYFRHDHGIFVAFGIVVLLSVHAWPQGLARTIRLVGVYAALTAACILPHLAYVQWHSGILSYLAVARDYSQVESRANPFGLPWFAWALIPGNSVPFLFWLYWLMPALGAAMLASPRAASLTVLENHRPKIAMVIALAVAVNVGFLRTPLIARLPDAAVPHTILGAWILVTLWRWGASFQTRAAVRVALVPCIALTCAAVATAADTKEHLARTGIWRGPRALTERWRVVTGDLVQDLSGLMPSSAQPLVPFLRYVRECTAPEDRLIYVGYEPEVFVLADRGFAGGHMMFFSRFHSAPAEQALTVKRLVGERVPFVLLPSGRRNDLREVFPQVWNHIEARYVSMTSIDVSGNVLEVLIERSRLDAASIHEPTGWPCFEERPQPRAAAETGGQAREVELQSLFG